MELINSNYIKISKWDMFYQIVETKDEKKYKKLKFFQRLVKCVMSNEREHRGRKIEDIYVRIDSLKDSDILNVSNLPISRQSLLNAILYASFVGDIETIQKLSVLMHQKEFIPSELGDMLSYVLEHSVDFNEWLNGECERFIYYASSGEIEKGYIYSAQKNTNVRKLK